MREMGWWNGIISTDDGQVIARPGISLHELLATPLGASASIKGFPPDSPHVVITPVMISGHECCVSVIFEHGIVREAMIVVTDNTANRLGFVTGYASPVDGPEQHFLEDWSRREVGKNPPATFRWGKIGEVSDGKGGFMRISFLYRNADERG